LLGPSGCGKTTLLRMVAGFNSIEAGTITFDSTVINNMPPYSRNIGMVFQNYAVFPHLTVRENVEYGLKLRKISRKEINKRVDAILETVKMLDYADRLPANLSGGQQQRIALARAIVIEPQVLLMDEPLSNLDAKLRLEMRDVIREIQNKVGITTIYVTHDQEEALAISDRIAVMNKGHIHQIADPVEIYTRPADAFVATFIGKSNLMKGVTTADGIVLPNGYTIGINSMQQLALGTKVCVSVRPEELDIATDAGEGFKARIHHRTFLGKYILYQIEVPADLSHEAETIIESSQDISNVDRIYEPGDNIILTINKNRVNIFNEDGSKSLMKRNANDEAN
jgi:iron(III) transport system ATP-binding protein